MENFSAYFYTLVSMDTEEEKYADQRQQHLIDQGFFFEVIQQLPFMKNPPEGEIDRKELIMSSETEQIKLFESLQSFAKNKDAIGIENDDDIEKDEDMKELNKWIKKNKKRNENE